MTLKVSGDEVKLENLWAVGQRKIKSLSLSESARKKMVESRSYLMKRLDNGEVMYGVNTGFGALSDVQINKNDIEKLQVNIIRSHSAGVGKYFSREETRAIMYLRANALARGHSGIRPEVVDKIFEFLNNDVLPAIPEPGSVGASGDLAPLSHLALSLIGEGHCLSDGGVTVTSKVLASKKIDPLKLQAKEGLSLINGCQVMTAVGLIRIRTAQKLVLLADVAGAMTLEAMRGTRAAFDPLISRERPHHGEMQTARNLLRILGPSSPIGESHIDCKRVQDAYSLRCMPAVHGAAKHAVLHNLKTLEIEANSSTDNPLVFASDNKILSGGNFHGEPVAFALDFLAIAMTALSSMSECRIEKLINPAMSGLAPFLAPNSGLNSGHMIVQVAAASLVSENKILSHPASVDSIPTSADKEDHVSMGTIAARKFGMIVENARNIIAMEFLSATQALDLLKPLKPAHGVLAAYDVIRAVVPFAIEDRIFSDDIKKIAQLIDDDSILTAVEGKVGPLEL